MKFKIPFTFSDIEILKRRSSPFIKFTGQKKSKLDEYLKNIGEKINKRQYLSICYRSFLLNSLFLSIVISTILVILKRDYTLIPFGFGSAILISGFILFNQRNYPKIFSVNKSKDIDKNLIPALQDMVVQLDSVVSIFKILINISKRDSSVLVSKVMNRNLVSAFSKSSCVSIILLQYGHLISQELFLNLAFSIILCMTI